MTGKVPKSATAFRTISEVATELDLPQHVLRFWETKFNAIRPMKRGGGRRYYRPEDVELLEKIRNLLYSDGYTIKGVQKLLRETGGKLTGHASQPAAVPLSPPPPPKAEPQDGDPSLRAELKSIASELENIRLKLLDADA
ncbi:MAG: MerR family transcriptional regulator [Proteobacteria bacterium]|nr:MerR family transcriptional regulator [Pseudomonadota bacterium]MDA1023184.1 MerR family transcriptional regulator [Pseudomonadota bacterium]